MEMMNWQKRNYRIKTGQQKKEESCVTGGGKLDNIGSIQDIIAEEMGEDNS